MKNNNQKVNKSERNVTYEYNNLLITNSYIKLIDDYGRKPTYEEIANDCGLHATTVQKHAETLEFKPLIHPLRVLSDKVLIAIYKSAIAGSGASQKLWFMIAEGWSEKQRVEHSGFTPTLVDLVKEYQDEEIWNKSRMENLIRVLKNYETRDLSLEQACKKFSEDEGIDLSEIIETIGEENLTLPGLIQKIEQIGSTQELEEKLKKIFKT